MVVFASGPITFSIVVLLLLVLATNFCVVGCWVLRGVDLVLTIGVDFGVDSPSGFDGLVILVVFPWVVAFVFVANVDVVGSSGFNDSYSSAFVQKFKIF